MTEIVSALKSPFVATAEANPPRPAVMAFTWAIVGLLVSRAL